MKTNNTENQKEKVRDNGFKRIFIAVFIILVIAVSAFAYWYTEMRGIVYSDDARFDGDLVDIAPQVSGVIKQISALEGSSVKKGDILFTLDDTVYAAAVSKAKAQLLADRAALKIEQASYHKIINGSRTEEIAIARSIEKKGDISQKLMESEFARIKPLYEKGVVSQSKFDKAKSAYETAMYEHEKATSQLNLLLQGAREEDVEAAKACVEASKAKLEIDKAIINEADINFDFTTIAAPFDGIIVRKWLYPGAMGRVGSPVLTLFDPSTVYVSANVDERDLNRISLGDNVDITVDSYPGLLLKGKVERILNAANSKFSLIPSEGVSGTYIKVAQRLELRISVNAPKGRIFSPGLSVEIRIHVSNHEKGENTGK